MEEDEDKGHGQGGGREGNVHDVRSRAVSCGLGVEAAAVLLDKLMLSKLCRNLSFVFML